MEGKQKDVEQYLSEIMERLEKGSISEEARRELDCTAFWLCMSEESAIARMSYCATRKTGDIIKLANGKSVVVVDNDPKGTKMHCQALVGKQGDEAYFFEYASAYLAVNYGQVAYGEGLAMPFDKYKEAHIQLIGNLKEKA